MAGPRQSDLTHQRHDKVERCWLCGIALPTAQLVPDGGSACADVRWYCRDLRACTSRWTGTARPLAGAPSDTATSTTRAPGRARLSRSETGRTR